MNEELKKAAEEVLSGSSQPQEFQRRLYKLLENVTTSNYDDADVRQVIELTDVSEEE
jgi:hypothetical protein